MSMYLRKTGRVKIKKISESTANTKNSIVESLEKFEKNITINAERANHIVTSPGIIISKTAKVPDKIAQNNAPILIASFKNLHQF